MNEEKWQQLKEGIGKQFKIIDEENENLFYENPLTNRSGEIGSSESLIFFGPGNVEQKLERTQKKIVLDKKMHYHRTKSDAIIELIFSPNEYSDTVKFYKKINDDWIEIQE